MENNKKILKARSQGMSYFIGKLMENKGPKHPVENSNKFSYKQITPNEFITMFYELEKEFSKKLNTDYAGNHFTLTFNEPYYQPII